MSDGDEGADAQKDDDDPMAMFKSLWGAPFMPNLLNTVVFLVETSQMVAVLFVNYKGRPWMKGLLENHALFLSVFLCAAGVAVRARAVGDEAQAPLYSLSGARRASPCARGPSTRSSTASSTSPSSPSTRSGSRSCASSRTRSRAASRGTGS